MYCVSVDFVIHPGLAEAFLERMRRQASQSLAREPGCRGFEVWTSTGSPSKVHLHEIYDDAAAFETHLRSEHFLTFDAETVTMVQEKSVTRWDRRLSA